MRRTLATFLLLAALLLPAAAPAQDTWGGADKKYHFYGTCAFGAVASQLFSSYWGAVGAAVLPWALKEKFHDRVYSAKDMWVNLAGASTCVGGMRYVVSHSNGVSRLSFTTPF